TYEKYLLSDLAKIEIIMYTKYRNIGGDVSIAEAIRPITYKNDLCILEAIFVSTQTISFI
ncbi:MAG: hypothetical protein WCY36_08240, partial [Candidatus Omnitrophota bacterium]